MFSSIRTCSLLSLRATQCMVSRPVMLRPLSSARPYTTDGSAIRFTRSHEWIKVTGDEAVVGISEHAQHLLGEIVFVDLPEPGAQVSAGDSLGAVESVKSSVDYYSPCDGTVIAVNEAVSTEPQMVNAGAQSTGWLVKMTKPSASQLEHLMDATAYAQHCEEEDA
mmetsp:Transcript_18923/g.48121  ORF Transcript_18923/g.48121 Transcript_18923/m.48121 type:complete len:165 (-) Transcript_18923:126-620(-)|eukprot:CAMPEP_0177657374 /NCGR_PEP_ID=MMETSP0447-20121125/16144_1 /TAXON_ID=0 /ORGANISM="Stygamoeba regulata, Strain BSH-02190019" /LENGTH=164 /DNA_ID=CAMNT_0019161711 /DNA_START=121 /DNA_END=615 /DNA_ORIENTATION=+